jgi:hypothetical protein
MTTQPPVSPEELEARRRAANPPKHRDAELLESGQEEVFSRTEVETGRIEHDVHAGSHHPDAVVPESARRDEAQTQRQAPPDAGHGEPAGGE